MSDLISRESLKQRINLNYNNHQYIDAQSIKDIINTEPPVEDKTVEELVKIICELRNCYTSMPIFNKRKRREENKAYLDCESIIFKHISELKGENK